MPTPATTPLPLTDPSLYINRDLSLLRFQRRVLEEARDDANPLLERIKFLAIFGSNMDEFFMVRLSRIRADAEARAPKDLPAGQAAAPELAAIRRLATELFSLATETLHREVLPRLDRAGVHVLEHSKLSPAQRQQAQAYFHKVLHPILTPLAVGAGHPFPNISNLSLNFAILMRDAQGNRRIVHLEVPGRLERLVALDSSPAGIRRGARIEQRRSYVWLEQIIAANLPELFPIQQITGVYPFRIIRDAGPQIEDLDSENLPEAMHETILRQSIQRREFAPVMQVAVTPDMPVGVRQMLARNLGVNPSDFYSQEVPLGLSSLGQLYSEIARPDLKYPIYRPAAWKAYAGSGTPGDIFAAIRERDILLHHPYDSFSLVVDFLNMAARDPSVLAIKQTLYRVGKNSPVVKALREASKRGKDVTVFVELKATFDEESNIGWAMVLEQSGVHVIYGMPGLKTHGKVGMVVRKEAGDITRYVHLATGNYNALTSKIYEDLGLFTCDNSLGADVTDLFNYLTGLSRKREYRKILVAPFDLRSRLEALIRREIEHARAGSQARMIFKVNSLVDTEIIRLLYEASQAGVQVDLLVRGMCCLRPHVKGVSDHINVISIVGRYLEHSRIFYFLNGGEEQIYLGSADLMERNLDKRVEVVFPLEDRDYLRFIRDQILELYLRDNQLAYMMQADGRYKRKTPRLMEPPVDVQNRLMEARRGSGRGTD
ncbi:MAG: polyphosphate kinase 1 [Bacteroidota bacterium]